MWSLEGLGWVKTHPHSGQVLKQRVGQLSTGVVALGYEMAAEPGKGLGHVMRHVQASAPSLLRSNLQLREALESLKATNEELQDGSSSLQAMTSSGVASVARMDSNLRTALQQAQGARPAARVSSATRGTGQ